MSSTTTDAPRLGVPPVPITASQHEGAARAFWRVLTRFDSAKLSPYLALRNSIGVLLPLLAGFTLNMPRGGVVVASGALNVAYSDGSDPYAQRAKRMLSSCALCALAVLLGALSGSHNAAAVIIATVWAFAAGMFGSRSDQPGYAADLCGTAANRSSGIAVLRARAWRRASADGAVGGALAGAALRTGTAYARQILS